MQDCNFDCNDSGIALQAMDNSHVALVSMMLKAESFSPYRCDRNIGRSGYHVHFKYFY